MLELSWSSPSSPIKLVPGQGHLWRFTIPTESPILPFESILNEEERDRALRFRFDKDRLEFAFSRGALRTLLGNYLGVPPQEIDFQYQDKGKPFLPDIAFNLSHSKGAGLIAIVAEGEVGVDVEVEEEKKPYEKLALRYFSDQEIEFLKSFPEQEQAQVFYQIWTLKEALIKGLGKGFSLSLKDFTVAWDLKTGEEQLSWEEGKAKPWKWRLERVMGLSGVQAAVAISRKTLDWKGFIFKKTLGELFRGK